MKKIIVVLLFGALAGCGGGSGGEDNTDATQFVPQPPASPVEPHQPQGTGESLVVESNTAAAILALDENRTRRYTQMNEELRKSAMYYSALGLSFGSTERNARETIILEHLSAFVLESATIVKATGAIDLGRIAEWSEAVAAADKQAFNADFTEKYGTGADPSLSRIVDFITINYPIIAG